MVLHYSDAAIINGLKKKESSSIKVLYREFFPVVRYIVEKNSGNHQDAEDVFQDGLIVLYKRILSPSFTLHCSLKTYFYAICKNIWLKRLERKCRLLYQADFEVQDDHEDYSVNADRLKELHLEKMRLYQHHFLTLPQDCQTILTLFLKKIPLKEIAGLMGLKDENYAKTRKYLCKNMLRRRIFNDPRCQQFLEYD